MQTLTIHEIEKVSGGLNHNQITNLFSGLGTLTGIVIGPMEAAKAFNAGSPWLPIIGYKSNLFIGAAFGTTVGLACGALLGGALGQAGAALGMLSPDE